MTWEIRQGDCLEQMRELDDDSIDAVVCDPPYGFSFMGKAWDTFDPSDMDKRVGTRNGTGPPSDVRDGRSKGRTKSAFANPGGEAGAYDFSRNGNAAFQGWCESWAREALRVLRPGGHLLAFGGTRTYHRLACAVEDAGFEIRDSVLWLYGSGFPKSRNLDGDWEGWGTALKPSHEPIVVGRKPLAGTVAANVLQHGTGAINVDGCRIGMSEEDAGRKNWHQNRDEPGEYPVGESVYELGLGPVSTEQNPAGRWPANVVLSEEAAAELDEQSGESKSSGGRIGKKDEGQVYGGGFNGTFEAGDPGFGDTGGASRFFYCAKTSRAERNAGLDGFEEKDAQKLNEGGIKARREAEGKGLARNHHPTVKPINLMRWLVRLVTPPGGLVLDPFTGSGTTGCAAVLEGFDFIGCEREAEYVAIARARIAFWEQHQGREVEDVLDLHGTSEKERRRHEELGQLTMEEAA